MQTSSKIWSLKTDYPQNEISVYRNSVYVSGSGVYCLEAKTGRQVWYYSTYGVVERPVVPTSEEVFFCCGGLYCLDADNGKRLWEFWSDQWGILSPVIGEKCVYAVLGNTVYSVDKKNGKKIWARRIKTNIVSLLLTNNFLLLKSKDHIVCLRADTGDKLWAESFRTGKISDAGSDRVCLIHKSRLLLCLDVKTGKEIWEYDTGDSRLKAPAFLQGHVYVLAMGRVTAFDASNGSLKWARSFEHSMVPAVYDGVLCAFSVEKKHHILRLDPLTGKTLKSGHIPENFSLLTEQYAFGTEGNTVYCMPIDYKN